MTSRLLLFLHLDRFYIQALNLDEALPVVVHRDKSVLDCSASASSRGVIFGMGLPEAKTLIGKDGTFVEWSPEPFGNGQADWLDICARFSDFIEPVDQHQAFIDLVGHPKPTDICDQLVSDLRSLGYFVKPGMSLCRWVAKTAAFSGDSRLAHLDPARFVASLPVSALPIEDNWSQRLALLGCQTVGEVRTMSPDALRRQFGKDAINIKRYVSGDGPSEVERAYPPDSLSDRFRFDGVADDLAVFDNGLKRIAQSLGIQLAERDVASEELDVWLEGESGQVHESRKFSKPIGSPASLLISLRLLCGAPKDPVSLIRVRVSNLKKGRRIQKTLDNLTAASSRAAASKTALAQVNAAFGDGSVMRASEVQQPRWKQVRSAWRSANGWTWR